MTSTATGTMTAIRTASPKAWVAAAVTKAVKVPHAEPAVVMAAAKARHAARVAVNRSAAILRAEQAANTSAVHLPGR